MVSGSCSSQEWCQWPYEHVCGLYYFNQSCVHRTGEWCWSRLDHCHMCICHVFYYRVTVFHTTTSTKRSLQERNGDQVLLRPGRSYPCVVRRWIPHQRQEQRSPQDTKDQVQAQLQVAKPEKHEVHRWGASSEWWCFQCIPSSVAL